MPFASAGQGSHGVRYMPEYARSLSNLAVVFLLASVTFGCGTTRSDAKADDLLQRRAEYQQEYLDQTNQRYTAILQRNKAELDAFTAHKRDRPPVIDYLIISGGGDMGAFGAGFLKGWSTVPK